MEGFTGIKKRTADIKIQDLCPLEFYVIELSYLIVSIILFFNLRLEFGFSGF